MDHERRVALRGTYLRLGTGELVAAAVFGLVAGTVVAPRLDAGGRAALWSALVPLLVVLGQAGAYWLAARSWVGRAPMPAAAATVLRLFRVADVALLLAGLVGVVVWWPGGLGAVLVAAVWVFGAVEYLNYYVVRLAYPAGRWFTAVRRRRAPRLVKDLDAAARRRP